MPVKKSKVKRDPLRPASPPASPNRGESLGGREARKLKVKIQKSQTKTKRAGSLSINVLNTKGKVVGKINLPKEIFQAKVNEKLMAQAVRVYLANQRQGTFSTKTRGEVAGSTRKLYRQKGTGRARAGSIRSPLRVGGGIVFGPKPRDFSLKLSKKMKRQALFSALTFKLKEKAIQIIDGLDKIEPKTKKIAEVLKSINVSKEESVLMVLSKDGNTVKRVASNIDRLYNLPAGLLNTYEVLRHKRLVVMRDSLEEMKKLWIKES